MATKEIPVAYAVPSSLSNFPVLIQPSVMTGWGSLTTAEANSIRFYSDAGLTTELAREVVSADEIHVKVGTLTSSTVIYADYDGVRSDYAVTDTYGRNAVWSGYNGVFHNGDATTSTVGDSTSNGYTGNKSAANQPVEADAKLSKGQSFTNTSWRIDHGTTLGNGNNITVSAWVRFTNLTGERPVLSKGAVGNYQFIFIVRSDGSLDLIQWTSVGANYRRTQTATGEVASNTWYLIHGVLREGSGNASIIYSNGSQRQTNSGTSGTWATSASGNFRQGLRGDNAGGGMLGIIEEVRIAPTNLSADWITTEYNNQNNPGTFWGTVTDAGGASTPRRLMMMGVGM